MKEKQFQILKFKKYYSDSFIFETFPSPFRHSPKVDDTETERWRNGVGNVSKMKKSL